MRTPDTPVRTPRLDLPAAGTREVSARPARCEGPIDTSALLDEVREEFGA